MPKTEVLLVEDSDADALLIKAYLRASELFSVARVETLAAAREALCGGETFDVVVLDLNLPDSIGIETFTSLHQQFPNAPVVILSGQEDEELAVAAVGQGAQDYVPKNKADADVLTRSLRYAIERNARRLAERRNLNLEHDLAFAREVQQHMLPHESPPLEGFDIAGLCQPAEACGGDFFDFIPLPSRKWGFVVADVSSHGYAPALIMVSARRVLRTCAPMHSDIAECLNITNRAVVEDTLQTQFVTMFLCCLDPASNALAYTGAGHPAYLLSADGEATTLDSSGVPLGLQADSEYEVVDSITLQPGDIVLLMTDGTYEAMDPNGNLFGEQRVFDFVHQRRDEPAAEILSHLLEELAGFCHPGDQRDDITTVLIKVAKQASPA